MMDNLHRGQKIDLEGNVSQWVVVSHCGSNEYLKPGDLVIRRIGITKRFRVANV